MSELIQVSLSQDTDREICDVHVRACVDDVSELADADVLYFARPTTPNAVVAQLDIYPGCEVCGGATVDGTLIIAVRGGRGGRREHASFVASILHALLASAD